MAKQEYGDKNIRNVDISPVSTRYMSLYGININLQRAIPLIQDGLKPVQRRFLYQMFKSYRTGKVRVSVALGELMKLHPHSDQGAGDMVARMCQPFTNNIPLLNAEGNAGNVTAGDDAASSRYLDITMPKFTLDVLFDEFDGKVSMVSSYDDSTVEPFCLPAKFPLILLNGSSGIGYTLSTNIPPYNLSEIADTTIKLLKNPQAKITLVPDLPTGCDIYVVDENSFIMQSSYEIDNVNYTITIKNTPYLKYMEKIDSALRDLQESPNEIKEILTADDESDLLNNDFRYVIRCKPGNLYRVVDKLFKRVPGFREAICSKNMVVVDTDFTTKKYSTYQILRSWIKYRLTYKRGWFLRELVEKTSRYDMLDGKLFMLSDENRDLTISIFRTSKDREETIKNLVEAYKDTPGKITTSQANFIADMRLHQLNVNEYEKTHEEIKKLSEEITYIREVVNDPQKIKDVIINEIKKIKETYGGPRRSKILNNQNNDSTNISTVQILVDGSVIFTETENPEHLSSDVTPLSSNEVTLIDDRGYFIKVDVTSIPHEKPFTLTSIGKSVMGNCVAVVSNPSNNVIMLSNKGRIKYMPVQKIPSNATRKPLIPLDPDEKLVSILEVTDSAPDLLVYTSDGLGKRIQISDLNLVQTVDAAGQFILARDNVSGMFSINPKKPFLVYVTRLGRLRVNHLKYLTTGKKFGEPKSIINLSAQDDLVAVFCADKDQTITLNHADGRASSVHIDTLPVTTMAIEPARPKHVPGVKVIRATLS